jgi:SNF2 family DNA or RNA helicase
MAYADRRDDKIVVRTEYRDRDLIRAVPGAIYKVEEHVWTVPLSWAGCLTLRGLFRDRLEIGPDLQTWAWEHRRDLVEPALALRTELDADLKTEDADRLYGFQRAGVAFMSHVRHALCTDEMGTGKTIQSIYTLRTLDEDEVDVFPALVVCPNSMKTTWRKEFAMWWPDVRVEILEGGRANRLKTIDKFRHGQADVLVVNWEALRGHSKLAGYGSTRLKHCHVCDPALRDNPEANPQKNCERCPRELNDITWHGMILDEAHRAKEPKAKQTRAAWALRTDGTNVRIALTGTPIANAPQDLWSSLHFINPKAWPARTKFIDRWCLQTYNPFGGMTVIGLKPETKDEFFAITDPHVIRRPKSLVLSQLPQKVYTQRYVDMSPKQAKAYKTMQEDMVAAIGDQDGWDDRIVAVNSLTQLTRLTQFASAYAELDDEGNVRLSDPSNKVDGLMEVLEEVDGKPIVVFAQSRQLIELASRRLEKAKIDHGLITGAQSGAERQAYIDRFQSGQLRAMLCTVGAGGVGITLTRADTLVFLQRSWSMVDNSQAEDRVHRIGSEVHESINIIDIISQGTIEEGQRLALQAKVDRMQEIVRDRELMKKMLLEVA